MGFVENFKLNADKLRDVYDLVAYCYDYLIEVVTDQAWFIGQYVLVNNESDSVNPNLKQLARFSKNIERYLMETECDRDHNALPFKQCMDSIVRDALLAESQLKPYKDEKLNFATVSLFILYAVDRYLTQSRMERPRSMPKNASYSGNSYIYLAPKHNILDEAAEQLNFPGVIEPLLIRSQLKNIIILEREELKGKQPPKVENLFISQNDKVRTALLTGKKLKVALIPFEREQMLQFLLTEGGAMFKVGYTEWYETYGVKYALKLLDMAICQKANIVVFPEYVCGSSVQESMRKYLSERYKTKPGSMRNLLLVVAGSGWTEDDDNVSCIYSYDGHLLGKQYKDSRFCKINENNSSCVEGLKSPGLETTICEIKGIGDIAFAICRDVSEPNKLMSVVERFRPQFLLVPAWSSSIHRGFEQQLGNFTERNHRTCSMVCNCCEALETAQSKSDVTSIIVTPAKSGSLIKGKTDYIPRKKAEYCQEHMCGGCVWMMSLCFEVKNVEKRKIVCGIKQKRCE